MGLILGAAVIALGGRGAGDLLVFPFAGNGAGGVLRRRGRRGYNVHGSSSFYSPLSRERLS